MGNVSTKLPSRSARRRALVRDGGHPTGLADALFTTTQQRVLALLFGQPSRRFYTSELIELTGSGSGAVQRELERLASSGLVNATRIGRQKHIALIAHDNRKPDLIRWVEENREVLARHFLCGTGTT